MRIVRFLSSVTTAVVLVVSIHGSAAAEPVSAPRHDASVASRLLLGIAGLPPVDALVQITRQLFGPEGRYLPWADHLPGLPVPYTPPVVECPSGAGSCVDEVLRKLEDRAAVMRENCDDNAPFLLTYLDVTRAEHRTAAAVVLMQLWREYAWRAAEQLLLASDPGRRAAIAGGIEGLSNLIAEVVTRLFARDDPAPHAAHCPLLSTERATGTARFPRNGVVSG